MNIVLLSIILTIISAAAHAGINAYLKLSKHKIVLRAMVSWVAAICFIPLMIIKPFPTSQGWLMLIASATGHFFYQYAQIQSLKFADLSIAYPVTRGAAPVFTTIASILLLSEETSVTAMIGIGIISLSVLSGISMAKMRNDKMLQKGVIWSLITGFCAAIYTVIDSYGGQSVSDPLSFIAWFFVFNGVGVTILSFSKYKSSELPQIAKTELKRAVIAGICAAISYGGIIYAFYLSGGKTAELAALRESGVIFGIILAYFMLDEDITIRRLLSAIGITIGVAVIAVATMS